MISALLPGFLTAGLALAAAAVVLHFLARRPPERQPLPTARFLSEDARTLLRLRRRPTDLWLLLVRIAFALALGASFAGVTWTPSRAGTGRIVLLDGSADSLADWDAAKTLARRAALEGTIQGPVPGTLQGTLRGTVQAPVQGTLQGGLQDTVQDGDERRLTTASASILVYGLDGGPRFVRPDELGALAQGREPATAEHGLRTLRAAVLADTRFDTVDVAWVTRPSWRLWSTGVGLLRPALWPGSIALVPVPLVAGPAQGVEESNGNPANSSRRARSVAVTNGSLSVTNEAGDPVVRALEALGNDLTSREDTSSSDPDWSFAEALRAGDLSTLIDLARRGTTVVLSGRLATAHADVPWVPEGGRAGSASSPDPGRDGGTVPSVVRGGIVLGPGVRLGSAIEVENGTPAPGAKVLAVFEDATAAAVASTVGAGCVVYLATSLRAPELASSPRYTGLVKTLGNGCDGMDDADGPLDRGALESLERPDLAAMVDVGKLATSQGYPLTPWLTLLALMLFGLEVVMTRERRS